MRIEYKNHCTIAENVRDFSLKDIFECGQCFRWNENADGSYTGVARGRALKLSQIGEKVIFHDTPPEVFEEVWYDYFDFGRDYSEIKKALSCDPVMCEAVSSGNGIRILHQDLWECVVSFIISASNNIPRIKSIIDTLCRSFGERLEYMGETYYTFPSPERINALTLEELGVIRAGFRDKYIADAAAKFCSGAILPEELGKMTAEAAERELLKINGVGSKVANCILLFSLAKYDSFPIDVWIKRIIEHYYFNSEERPLSEISAFARKKFGELGGFAQQYLFFHARENKIGAVQSERKA